MSSDNIYFIRFDLAAQLDWLFFATIPSRNWLVIACTSPAARSNSAAICSFERFKPIKYKHSTQTRKG